MELRHLRSFAALAEELHFGRAASRLNIVQPALSQQLRQLERDVGARLVERSKRRVALTDAGAAFLVEARRTLGAASDAVHAARSAASGDSGRLRVGYVDLATWDVLPDVLRAFRRRFPRVELSLVELHREPQRDALLRGDLDVGFFTLRESERALRGALVVDEPLLAALPADHPLAGRARLRLERLAQDDWVLFPTALRTVYAERVLGACASAGFVPRVVQEAGQMHTLEALVAAGFGVTLLPAALRRNAPAARRGKAPGRVALVPLAGSPPRLPLHVVWRVDDLTPTGRQLVAIAAERTAVRQGSYSP